MLHYADMPQRGVLAVSGPDALEFLDNLVTNKVSAQRVTFAALLSPQGRWLHDFFIVPVDGGFLLECERARLPDLLQRLKRYRLRRAVELLDVSDNWQVLALWPSTDLKLPALVYEDPRAAALGQRALVKTEERPALHTILSTSATAADYTPHRLLCGVADGSADMAPEHALPLEYNFDLTNGVSFTKGCYIGQELTARMHHRDLLKKRLVRVESTAPLPPSDTPIMAGEQEAGILRSHHDHIGLALLRLEHKDQALTINAQPLTVYWPEDCNHD